MQEVRNYWTERGVGVESKVIGVRGNDALWGEIDRIAEEERMTRNGLIIKILSEFVKKNGKK
jgi:predicted DNA-binding ribbon-helix-helix protein